MFNEIKKAFKIISYGSAVKKQVAFAAFFAVIGIVIEAASKGANTIGGIYICLSGIFAFQMICSVDMSTLVQSSPYKKKIQCSYPYRVTIPWIYISYAIITLINWLGACNDPSSYVIQSNCVLYNGIMLAIILLYTSMAYKFFIVAMISMTISVMAVTSLIGMRVETAILTFDNLFAASTIIGFAIVTVCSIAAVFITRKLYKYDLSKWAFRGMLRTN